MCWRLSCDVVESIGFRELRTENEKQTIGARLSIAILKRRGDGLNEDANYAKTYAGFGFHNNNSLETAGSQCSCTGQLVWLSTSCTLANLNLTKQLSLAIFI